MWRFRLEWTGEPGVAGWCSRAHPEGNQPGRGPNAPGSSRRAVLDRTEKREFVASLADVFATTSMVLVTQNKGMTVAEVTD